MISKGQGLNHLKPVKPCRLVPHIVFISDMSVDIELIFNYISFFFQFF